MTEKICTVDGCVKKHQAKGFCLNHYRKWRKFGDPLYIMSHQELRVAKGYEGRYQKRNGIRPDYWMVLFPGHPNADSKGYVLEHRLVMEKKIGRLLDKKEIVHHIDGDGLNNKEENLTIMDRGSHVKHHEYWETSPRKGNVWAQKEWNLGLCKKEGCGKQAKAKGYCHNHNRDIWRNKQRAMGLAYT